MLDAFFPKHLDKTYTAFFYLLAIVFFMAEVGYVLENRLLFLSIPFVVLVIGVFILDIKVVYYLLWATIPISIQYSFQNGLSTDLPTEPLIALLMFGLITMGIKHFRSVRADYLLHPISIFLILHFLWIGLTALVAENFVIAIKFLLAKTWYIVTFYMGSLYLLRSLKDYKRLVITILVPLTFIVSVILVKHAIMGFTFMSANYVINPFFRNHVDYASLLVVFIPFVWYYYKLPQTTNFYIKAALVYSFLILIAGIFFSYTRAAFVSLGLIVAAYYLIKYRWMKYALVLTLILSTLWISSLIKNNRYLKYAPNFEQTVAHKDFESLLSATYKLRDISTMERVYRWVAGFRMIRDHPWMGFGPNGFYPNYRPYTIRAFETYVSDNPEKSGIHNYYLMTTVEQGILGLIIFLVMSLFVLIYGERLYHSIREYGYKLLVMAALMSHVAILSILLINDMIETVKVGPVFFLNLAIIVGVDIRFRNTKPSRVS